MIPFTKEEKLKIKSLRESGMTHADIAKKHFPARSENSISSVCKRYRYIMEPHFKFTDEEKKLIKDLTEQGISFKEITKRVNNGKSMIAIRSFAMQNGFKNGFIESGRKYTCNKNFWDQPNLINSYWAGFVAADGHVHYEGKNSYAFAIKLQTGDKGHLQLFSKHCDWNGNLLDRSFSNVKLKREVNYSRILVHQREWAKPLEEIFCIFPRKTWSLDLPNISGELLDCYLAGFIDGDGSYCEDKDRMILSAVGATSNILRSIDSLSKRFDTSNRTRKIHKYFSYYQYAVAGPTAVKTAHYLMSLPCPHLERKYNKVRNYLLANPKYNLSLPPYEEKLAQLTAQC